jgi:hypothetical protein
LVRFVNRALAPLQPEDNATQYHDMSTPVFVNVYKLIPEEGKGGQLGNDALELIKMGVYHAGVEILGQEYSFGMDPTGKGDPEKDGVFVVRPRTAVGSFKEQVPLGNTNAKTKADVNAVLDSIRPRWKAATYNILNHNCCYFSLDFAKALSAAFEKPFPHYVCNAASVGDKVVPAALLSSLTTALAPPSAPDPSLVGKIDVKTATKAPKPLAALAPPAPAAKSGGLFGMAKGLASNVTDKVKGAVDDSSRKSMHKAFPDVAPADLVSHISTAVVHLHHEQKADAYLTSKALCVAGDNGLATKVPLDAIVSIQYGAKVPPPAKGLPPTFNVAGAAPQKDAALMVFLKDGRMIPLFDFTVFGSSGVMGKITGTDPNSKLMAAFTDIDTEWRKVVKV